MCFKLVFDKIFHNIMKVLTVAQTTGIAANY